MMKHLFLTIIVLTALTSVSAAPAMSPEARQKAAAIQASIRKIQTEKLQPARKGNKGSIDYPALFAVCDELIQTASSPDAAPGTLFQAYQTVLAPYAPAFRTHEMVQPLNLRHCGWFQSCFERAIALAPDPSEKARLTFWYGKFLYDSCLAEESAALEKTASALAVPNIDPLRRIDLLLCAQRYFSVHFPNRDFLAEACQFAEAGGPEVRNYLSQRVFSGFGNPYGITEKQRSDLRARVMVENELNNPQICLSIQPRSMGNRPGIQAEYKLLQHLSAVQEKRTDGKRKHSFNNAFGNNRLRASARLFGPRDPADLREAAAWLEKAYRESPGSQSIPYLNVLVLLDDRATAAKLFAEIEPKEVAAMEKSKAKNPGILLRYIWNAQARFAFRDRDYAKAVELWKKSGFIQTDDFAEAAYKIGDYDACIKALEQISGAFVYHSREDYTNKIAYVKRRQAEVGKSSQK